MGSHIITIDIDNAVAVVRETIRRQLNTITVQRRSGRFNLVIAVDGPDGPGDLVESEEANILDNVARNVVQALHALEVPE